MQTCALRGSGRVVCWGANLGGALGDGTQTSPPEEPAIRTEAAEVLAITDAVEIALDLERGCARGSSGTIQCWGGVGQHVPAGDGESIGTDTPVAVLGIHDAIDVAVGGAHACAVRGSGTVLCWGLDRYEQLGAPARNSCDYTPCARTAVPVAGLRDVVQVAAGDSHTCALREGGTVACWGLNACGMLGDGSIVDASSPVQVAELTDAVELAAGSDHTCARRTGGTVVCWGNDGGGQLGDGSTAHPPCSSELVGVDIGRQSRPVTVLGVDDAIQLAAGGAHTCALRASGAVACWGGDYLGQLGDGATAVVRNVPVEVLGLDDAVEVAAGWQHTCARRDSGEVVCWGWNGMGQLGDGTTTDRLTPTPVVGL